MYDCPGNTTGQGCGDTLEKVTSSLILKIELIKSTINGKVLVVTEAAQEMEV